MPHGPTPVIKTSPQITPVEPTIRMPAWRSDPPKNVNTRRPHTSCSTRAMNLPISPLSASHSRGSASSSLIGRQPSFEDDDLRMRGQQRLREHVVERAKRKERD